jgi:3-oxoacyl-[acyl-carrier protein] reductase
MADLDFSGQNIIVIGGSTGIGNAIAQAFCTRGAAVHVTGTRASADQYGTADFADMTGLTYSNLDCSEAGSVGKWDCPPTPSLNALILCQGATRIKLAEFQHSVFREIMEINLNSMLDCCERLRSALATAKGSVVLVSSVAAYRTLRNQPAYTASKTAILGLTRALAASYITEGIRVNGVAPGFVHTKMSDVVINKPDYLAATLRTIPINRPGQPSELAGAAIFLASPLASYIVGHTLVVDGGMLCAP